MSFNFFKVLIKNIDKNSYVRSSHPEVFLGKGILKTCSKFTGEHPYCFTEVKIWHDSQKSFLLW